MITKDDEIKKIVDVDFIREQFTKKKEVILLPCPFCGSSNVYVSQNMQSYPLARIMCGHCNALSREQADIQEARKAWNARADNNTKIDE